MPDQYFAVTVWSNHRLEADNQAYLQKAFRSVAFVKRYSEAVLYSAYSACRIPETGSVFVIYTSNRAGKDGPEMAFLEEKIVVA